MHYNAIWLSDIHLGYRDCKANFLLDFLNKTHTNRLYLVGDVVDLWAMKRTRCCAKSSIWQITAPG